jgi:hypothetical protein
MPAFYERIQILLRPDQREELARRARESKQSMAEITRQLLDTGIRITNENDEISRTCVFLEKVVAHRRKMKVMDIDIVELIHGIREDQHD